MRRDRWRPPDPEKENGRCRAAVEVEQELKLSPDCIIECTHSETVLVAALAAEINAEHERAFGAAREALEHAHRAGKLLLEAKAAVEHGQWLPWLTANVKFSERTAQAYMRLASRWGQLPESAAVADLPLRQAMLAISTNPEEPRRAYRIPYENRNKVCSTLKLAVTAIRKGATALQRQDLLIQCRGVPPNLKFLRKTLADALLALDNLEREAGVTLEKGAA